MENLTEEEMLLRDSELLNKRALQIHRGAARAAVLGVNDGLVSVLCLILAVHAAQDSTKTVILAGFAGLIAGAISMAAGEWISVTSQVDLFRGVLDDVKRLLKEDRKILVNQLREDFEGSGVAKKTAEAVAEEISKDDEHLMQEYAENVMKINPDELGSPWVAAFSSFALFTAGALFALAPWFFIEGDAAAGLSILFTVFAGSIVGGYVTNSSGDGPLKGALRQILIIAFASVITYGVGYLFGTVFI